MVPGSVIVNGAAEPSSRLGKRAGGRAAGCPSVSGPFTTTILVVVFLVAISASDGEGSSFSSGIGAQ